MSSKHYFPEVAVNTLVPLHLKALCTANPSLALIEELRVVLNTAHSSKNVSLISGGGSGHEPSWSGYVGDGLLSAVACGDIFASPSMKQVLAAIAAVPSEQGTILLITNYTGDKLHFGLAAERALERGLAKKCVVLAATDDVSIGRSKCGKVGRRGLAGNSLTMKILGAGAAKGWEFGTLVEVGRSINEGLVSVGSTLEHCHVPGRQNHEEIGSDTVVVGAGIHNEPGAQKVSPFPSVEDLIGRLLTLLCDQNDPERAFVKFNKDNDVVLLINNYGGLSNLELGALTQETLSQLGSNWSISPTLIYSGTFETSLNGPGFSVTLCNLSHSSTLCKVPVPELLSLLSSSTSAPSWPNVLSNTSTKSPRKGAPEVDLDKEAAVLEEEDIKITPEVLDSSLKAACDRAIAAEPDLTKWDMLMGDGDCGEAVYGLCTAILKHLESGIASSGSVLTVLHAITAAVDDMGGTLGAIFGILLAALVYALKTGRKQSSNTRLIDIFATALKSALGKLKEYTAAREGDRTVMDVLIPFVESLDRGRDFAKAVEVAKEKAEATRNLKASFGRASYVGVEGKEEEGVPDPGAWALYELVRGLEEGARS